MDEGKQFYISSVRALGLEEDVACQNVWKDLPVKPGDVYDARLWDTFMRNPDLS
jgi:hypothetical protein